MINVINLRKSFDTRTLWEKLSFNVENGTVTALVGPSGCGKTTLLNCIGLLDTVNDGEIRIDDKKITQLKANGRRKFRRDSLGYLFQNYALIEDATIEYNLKIAARFASRESKKSQSSTFSAALDRVGLSERGTEPVYRLSGGEQQRVALARLLVKNPKVVLADEPTGALDKSNGQMVMTLLKEIAASGSSVVIATHDPLIENQCTNVIRLGSVQPSA